MNACPQKYGCCGNYLLAWNVAQMSVIPSLFASYSPRSVRVSCFHIVEDMKEIFTGVIVTEKEFCENK